jgi:hypothetical protein
VKKTVNLEDYEVGVGDPDIGWTYLRIKMYAILKLRNS